MVTPLIRARSPSTDPTRANQVRTYDQNGRLIELTSITRTMVNPIGPQQQFAVAEFSIPGTVRHFGKRHHLPVIDITMGNWTGSCLIDTGASRTIV